MKKIDTSAYLLPTDMVFIKGGSFEMGDVFDDNPDDNEKPVHRVRVDDFYMSAHCVTFEEYLMYCDLTSEKEPSDNGWGKGNNPVIDVNWYDAIKYCNFLSLRHGLEPVYTIDKNSQDPNDGWDYDEEWIVTPNWQANGYRLPTEAEWEYAARQGGKKVRLGNGKNILNATEVCYEARETDLELYEVLGDRWYRTEPVDSFLPNALGLYNMSGNVFEWCWDWYDGNYYKTSPAINPRGPENGAYRVCRGGSWNAFAHCCRAAFRISYAPGHRGLYIGFRVLVSP